MKDRSDKLADKDQHLTNKNTMQYLQSLRVMKT